MAVQISSRLSWNGPVSAVRGVRNIAQGVRGLLSLGLGLPEEKAQHSPSEIQRLVNKRRLELLAQVLLKNDKGLARLFDKKVQEKLEAPLYVPHLQISHSQGAIHLRNALMSYPRELRDRIIVVAIAPGAYIDQSPCHSVIHYKTKWNRDIVPFCDPVGRMLNSKNVAVLSPHKDAPGFDHDFQSPTYKIYKASHSSIY